MKREILFKAKRIDNGEWVYGDLITDGKGSNFNVFHIFPEDADEYSFDHCVRVHPYTVCQFTGLLDKNGNKIFDGDKLESEKHGNAFVVYDESVGMYGMKLEGSESIDFDLWLYCKHAVVTSNIHDK